MKTRSFIGLILLVAMLLMVSSPAVLKQAAAGVEVGADKMGVPRAAAPADPTALEAPTDGRNFDEDAGDVDVAEGALIIKGYDVGETDLRDRFEAEDRALNQRGRLDAGQRRLLLPGQIDRASLLMPPATMQDGVLLDIDGCPVFGPNDDVALMMADEEISQRYADKVASADDPDTCSATFDARMVAATDPEASPASQMEAREARRDVELAQRTGGLGLVTLTSYVVALESIFGITTYGDAVFAEIDARAGTADTEATDGAVATTTNAAPVAN